MRSGVYDDWHPPVMARLWSLIDAAGPSGTAPLFVLQTVMFYAGLALFVAAVTPRRGRAVAALALLVPADWMTVVVKDAQMVAALTLATGLVAVFRLRARALPPIAVAAVVTLLAYAILLRANAAFGVMPLACAWANWSGLRTLAARGALVAVATLVAIGSAAWINHAVLGARASHVERVLPVFDLAGIAYFSTGAPIARVPPTVWRAAAACYDPYLWDALGDDARCGVVAETLGLATPAGAHLIGEWARAIATEPFAYARHRLAHFNTTMRFLVPFGQPNAGAPPDSQPNDLGLGHRGDRPLRIVAAITRGVAATPLGWPIVWLAASAGLALTAAATPRSPPRDLALGLFVSAAAMLASFAVVSIASDLRYHLWSIVATVLGALALARCPVARPPLSATLAAVTVVAIAGTVARLTLTVGSW